MTISKPKTVMSIALALKKEKAEEEKKDDGMAEPSTDVERLIMTLRSPVFLKRLQRMMRIRNKGKN